MSTSVPVDALAAQVRRYGEVAFVITVSPEGAPHSVSVRVGVDAGELRAAVGRTTAANAERAGAVTVLWPPVPGGAYSLIVDGTATVDLDGEAALLRVAPTRAVEHRQADADPSMPSCVVVE